MRSIEKECWEVLLSVALGLQTLSQSKSRSGEVGSKEGSKAVNGEEKHRSFTDRTLGEMKC